MRGLACSSVRFMRNSLDLSWADNLISTFNFITFIVIFITFAVTVVVDSHALWERALTGIVIHDLTVDNAEVDLLCIIFDSWLVQLSITRLQKNFQVVAYGCTWHHLFLASFNFFTFFNLLTSTYYVIILFSLNRRFHHIGNLLLLRFLLSCMEKLIIVS